VAERDELERLEPFKSLSTKGMAILRQGLVRKHTLGPAMILQKGRSCFRSLCCPFRTLTRLRHRTQRH